MKISDFGWLAIGLSVLFVAAASVGVARSVAGGPPDDRCRSDRAVLVQATRAARHTMIEHCGDKCQEGIADATKALVAVGEEQRAQP